jgi:ArsR family transcriptional regulator, lead/cadmium/zinc/bismuth-responsive transcriptional repressor
MNADASAGGSARPRAVPMRAEPSERTLQRVADLYDVLADRTRVGIVFALAAGELCVGDLAARSGLSVSAASHQLRRLRDLGIVGFRRSGRMAYYRLEDPKVRGLVMDGVAWARDRGRHAAA